MTLATVSRLGIYDVTAPIGESGMGQVYRARDTKLDREVGNKILPKAFAHDADRLADVRALQDRRGLGWSLQTMAMIDAAEGRAARSVRLYGAAATLESIGAAGQMTIMRVHEAYLDTARQALGDDAFATALAEGRMMPLTHAVRYALQRSS